MATSVEVRHILAAWLQHNSKRVSIWCIPSLAALLGLGCRVVSPLPLFDTVMKFPFSHIHHVFFFVSEGGATALLCIIIIKVALCMI